jgi:hypothetical protein
MPQDLYDLLRNHPTICYFLRAPLHRGTNRRLPMFAVHLSASIRVHLRLVFYSRLFVSIRAPFFVLFVPFRGYPL